MIKKIVIAGTGFSGWYTALSLLNNIPDIKITIVGSSKIPKLNVGEAMAFDGPTNLKNLLGFKNDNRFMRSTGAIYKYGVEFNNWNADNTKTHHGKLNNLIVSRLTKHYANFTYPDYYEDWSKSPGDAGVLDTWLWLHQQNPKTMQDLVDENSNIHQFAGNPWAPYDRNNDYISRVDNDFTYHFDADRTVYLLKEVCNEKYKSQITEVDAIIQGIDQDDAGNITSVIFDDNTRLAGDLFLDLTGLKRVLIHKLYPFNTSWKDYSDFLPDSAMVYPRKYSDPVTEMIGGTKFSGLDYGWGFKINLYHRTGNGYCYMSKLADKNTIYDYMQSQAGEFKLVNPMVISWEPGYYEKTWQGNTIALGIASGLLHPFDGNVIGTQSRGLETLIKILTTTESFSMPEMAEKFNQQHKPILDEVEMRMTLMFGFSKRSGEFWDLQRQKAKERHYLEQLQEIIEMRTTEINKVRPFNWQQAYLRLAVSCDVDISKFNLPKPTDADLEMSKAFFQYTRAVNKYIQHHPWPNYYEWLKQNRFDGRTSDEIFDEFV
jgi:tryptophan halogenase